MINLFVGDGLPNVTLRALCVPVYTRVAIKPLWPQRVR